MCEITGAGPPINARVQTTPESRDADGRAAVSEIAARMDPCGDFIELQCFSPAYPNPPYLMRWPLHMVKTLIGAVRKHMVTKQFIAIIFGEMLGTFILVFFGTAMVAVAVLFQAASGLVQVALVWGIGVTLAIYATRHLSCAHLNPAVSLGMVLAGRMRPRLLIPYWISQLAGAVLAGALVLLIFGSSITNYEAAHGIARGSAASVKTAMMFGEYFPNPGFSHPWFDVSIGLAMTVEAVATFLLVTMIFLLTEGCNVGRPSDMLAPVFIGAAVMALIAVTAPFTQTGLNPARDFGPRLIAWAAGWGQAAIPGPKGGFFAVYMASPMAGAAAAAAVFRWVITPLMAAKLTVMPTCGCDKDQSQSF